jgi:hypothetical protein
MEKFKLPKANPIQFIINFLLIGVTIFVFQLTYPSPYFWTILFLAIISIESIVFFFTNKKTLIEISNNDIIYTGLFGKTTIKFNSITDIYERKEFAIGDGISIFRKLGIYIETKNQDSITIEERRFEKDYKKIKLALEKGIKKQIKFKTDPQTEIENELGKILRLKK